MREKHKTSANNQANPSEKHIKQSQTKPTSRAGKSRDRACFVIFNNIQPEFGPGHSKELNIRWLKSYPT